MEKVLQVQINLCELAQKGIADQVARGELRTDSGEYVKQVQAVNRMVKDLSQAKIDYSKAVKQLAGTMSPDDVLQAAIDRIVMEPKAVIKRVVRHLQDMLEEVSLVALDAQSEAAPPDTDDFLALLGEADDD